jgi:hypothetical protein
MAMTPEQHDQEHIELHKALFGDEETGQIGLVQMNSEMYKAWSIIIAFGKILTTLVIFFAALGTAWMAFGQSIIKFLKSL